MRISATILSGADPDPSPDRMSSDQTRKELILFAFLQVLDVGTTVLALKLGGHEKNPLIRQFMVMGPITGLVVSKIMVIAFAGGCAFLGKPRPVMYANLLFAGIVVWNVGVIIGCCGEACLISDPEVAQSSSAGVCRMS